LDVREDLEREWREKRREKIRWDHLRRVSPEPFPDIQPLARDQRHLISGMAPR
jgi:hypothetical protein